MNSAEPVQLIEVFADVVCPFTHVGLRRLFALRQQRHREDIAIQVRAWPLELVNDERVSRELLVEEIDDLREAVAADLFKAFDPELFPMTSLPALALAATAYRIDMHRGEQVSRALRDALFEEGRDLTNVDELLRIGQPATVDDIRAGEADVQTDLAEGRSRGVIGSPHFFVGDADFFCPTLAIERVDGHLKISFDDAGFNTFIDRCFG